MRSSDLMSFGFSKECCSANLYSTPTSAYCSVGHNRHQAIERSYLVKPFPSRRITIQQAGNSASSNSNFFTYSKRLLAIATSSEHAYVTRHGWHAISIETRAMQVLASSTQAHRHLGRRDVSAIKCAVQRYSVTMHTTRCGVTPPELRNTPCLNFDVPPLHSGNSRNC